MVLLRDPGSLFGRLRARCSRQVSLSLLLSLFFFPTSLLQGTAGSSRQTPSSLPQLSPVAVGGTKLVLIKMMGQRVKLPRWEALKSAVPEY